MSNVPTESVYREAGCVFRINRKTAILNVKGQLEDARPSIMKLRREGWLPKRLRAVIFENEVHATLLVGINLKMYLTVRPERPKPRPKTFKELVNSDQTARP